MTDLEFEKMMVEKRISDSRTLIMYMDSALIKPENSPYLTSVYLTSENCKYFNKVILEEYIFIFIVCKNSDDMKAISYIYNIAIESVFIIPIVLIDDSNINYLHEKLFNSAILISQVQYEENSLVLSDSIKSIWESMFHHLITKDPSNDVLTEYADVRCILNTKGITLYRYITHNSITAMKNNLKKIFNSESFPKNLKSILVILQVHYNYPILEISNIIDMFHDINPEVAVVFSIAANDNVEIDFIGLHYFLCGLTSVQEQ